MCLRHPLYDRFKYVAHREEFADRMLACPSDGSSGIPVDDLRRAWAKGLCAVDGAVAVPSGLWITLMLLLRYRSY
ncbi:MAG: hypothetical protein M3036_00830, partial [Bifidobacteriales bacterium]|nr:hypothetical protein [Bifidobacteriales bacterium]